MTHEEVKALVEEMGLPYPQMNQIAVQVCSAADALITECGRNLY